MSLLRPLALLVVLLVVLLAACSDSGADPDGEACAPIEPGDRWTSPGGAIIEIVATNPSPPARFTNWWAITVDDRRGDPMIDPARLRVSAFMPEHGHGAPVVPGVSSESDGLVVGPLELWMPGRWEIRFDLDSERIVVPVCLDE